MSGIEVRVAPTITGADGPAVAPVTAERPEHIPEKFWDAEKGAVNTEGLLKSYSELEKRQSSQPKAEEPAVTPAANPLAVPPAEATPEDAAAVVADAGLDMSSLETEFAQTGTLADASYTALEAKGIPRAMVDAYIAGQQALGVALTTRVHNEVGGAETFTKMTAWASQNLSEAERGAFNTMVDTGDEASIMLATRGLHAKYTAAVGRQPNLAAGSTTQASQGSTFRSQAELSAAINDPRYERDPAYQADVHARLNRSPDF